MPVRMIISSMCLLTVVGAAGARAESIIKDGSFEKPVVTPGTYTDFAKGHKIGPWTVVGDGGAVSVVSGTFTTFGYSFPAAAGEQWLDLTGSSSNAAEGIEQTVDTVPGLNYRLAFGVGNISGGPFGTSSTVQVLLNGAQVLMATNRTLGTTLSWEKFSFTFRATGSTTTIDFINADPPNDNSNALDKVSLTMVP